jgi:hypothetical protein
MRTTVRLDDDLPRQAKALAGRTGRTLAAVIEDGLREVLARHRRRQEPPPIALPTFKGKGLPDVNVLLGLRWRDRGG